jgi:hypothetical protein
MQLSLTDDEAVLLQHVLNRYLPSLREEVYKTENYEMRQELKADEALLKELIGRLERAHA